MKEVPRENPQAANIIDRAFAYVAPVFAAKRQRARAYMKFMARAGSYIGASKNRRATKEWSTPAGDADADTIYDLATLRYRSRDLLRNAPVAVGAVSTSVTNVVGTGLKLQSRIDAVALGMKEEEAAEWEEHAERKFNLWAETRECDAARTLNFYGLQELTFRQSLENGEAFTLLPRFKRAGSPYLLKLQPIEADRVCNDNNVKNTINLMEGVEKDDYGAPVAYHVMNQHPYAPVYDRKKYTWTRVPAFGGASGQPNILHLFKMLRPGQTRGVPYLAPVIEPLKQLDRYTEAELMAAVVASMLTVFIKSSAGDLALDTTGLGVETGATAADTDIKLGTGAIVGLPKGRDISIVDPKRPNTAFEPFINAILEQIGTALEIPYEIIIRHFSASYSASRAALLEAWRFFRGRRAWLAANFCQPVYEAWLYEAIAAGQLSAPGFFRDDLVRKAYSGTLWVADAPGYIDPAKDIEAAQLRMEAGVSTLDEETTLLTGGDYEKNLPRIAKERKKLEEIGLWQPVQKRAPAPAQFPSGKDKTKNDKEDVNDEEDEE